jgi:HEAT repeat protein
MATLTEALERIMNWLNERRFNDPKGVDLLLEALQVWSQAKGRFRDEACSTLIWALGEMCDVRALQPLTNALQDDSSFVREEAQAALLRLREMLPNV